MMKRKLTKNEKVVAFYKMILGEEGEAYAIANPEEAIINVENYVNSLPKLISEKEAYVLNSRYGINFAPKTLYELSQELNVSRERVRQISIKAIRKLKHPTRSKVAYSILLDENICDNDEDIDLSNALVIDLPFTIRIMNILNRNGIYTLEDLLSTNTTYLKSIKLIQKEIDSIIGFLNKNNLEFK